MADDFLTTYTPLANDIATQTGVDPSVVLAIIDTETGHGVHVAGNNIFGISPGGRVAGYPDVETASQAFVNLMQAPRYQGVAQAGDPASQAAALVRSGYNTVNPNYAGLVAGKALAFGKQLGYQALGNGPATTQVSTPDYNTPAPSAQQPKQAGQPQTETDKALASLPGGGGDQAQKPAAQQAGQTETDKALASLPPETKPPVKAEIDRSQGYFAPDGSYVPPQAMPTPQQAQQPSLIDTAGAAARARLQQQSANPILDAMRQGWEGTPTILTPQAQQAVNQWAPGGVELGRYVVNPLAQLGGAALGAAGATFRGGQQAVSDILSPLNPQLARDIAALPEAFPTGGAEFHPLTPPTAQAARTALGRNITVADITDAMRRADQAAAAEPPPTGAAETAGPEMSAAEAPQPQAAGAAATPGSAIPAQTTVQRARSLRDAINQSATDRAGPNLRDDTAYVTAVPGGTLPTRPYFQRDFDPQNALDAKRRYADSEGQDFRRAADANQAARNQGMVDLLRSDAGDELTLDALRQARRQVAPQRFGAFDNAQPVDAQPLVDHIDQVLDSPEGKRDAVQRTMSNVRDKLYDADGNLETSPEILYGVRQHIDDLLDKAKRPTDREGNDAAVARFALRDLTGTVDNTIQSGAPNYQAYRDAYRQASQPINQQQFLQRYQQGGKKLTGADGNLRLNSVNQMLEDIHKGLTDTKFNLAQSLTDQQIQNVLNVRNELAAKKLADDQAKVRGSDSYQLFNRAAETGGSALGRVLKGTAELGAHAGLGYLATHGVPEAGMANALMAYHRAYVRPERMVRKAAQRQVRANALAAQRDAQLLSQEANPLNQY